jgi:RNA polymerase sigma-70 factor (ECF subfamily)
VGAQRKLEVEDRSDLLGDVLYADKVKPRVSEAEWLALVQSIAAGNQAALHALYERAHRPVFTLIVRITANRETAEELTLDVFHDVWRRDGFLRRADAC